MLKITNLQKTFNPGTVNAKIALSGLDLTIEEGEFIAIVGTSDIIIRLKEFAKAKSAFFRLNSIESDSNLSILI